MTAIDSARVGGRHAAPDDTQTSAPEDAEASAPATPTAAPYLLRRRAAESAAAPDSWPTTVASALPRGPASADLGYAPALPVASFEDYVHPDLAIQWQRQKSRHGGLIALLLVVVLALGAGAYWYLQIR